MSALFANGLSYCGGVIFSMRIEDNEEAGGHNPRYVVNRLVLSFYIVLWLIKSHMQHNY